MVAVDLEDELIFQFEPADGFEVDIIEIKCADETVEIPRDERNLIVKALKAFNQHLGKRSNCKISLSLKKRVPVAGGMGGGSGNAAAALLAINSYLGEPVSMHDLHEIASGIGADVPFFLKGGAQVGRLRGDVLTPIEQSESPFISWS